MLILALCFGMQAVATAQEAHKRKGSGHSNITPEQRAEKQTAKMQQALQLSDAQKKEVYQLNLQSAQEMQAARKEARDGKKEKFKAMHERKEARLKSSLSADQSKKYQQMQEERKNKMKQKHDDK